MVPAESELKRLKSNFLVRRRAPKVLLFRPRAKRRAATHCLPMSLALSHSVWLLRGMTAETASDVSAWDRTHCFQMGNIHLNCLKNWIKQKINIEIKPYVTTVNWNSFSCELCHSPYPFAVYFDGIIYELLDVPYPKPPFIVLEGVTDKNLDSGVVFIVSFGKLQKIFVGRSFKAEWNLDEIGRAHV